jgi:hypothetical protein
MRLTFLILFIIGLLYSIIFVGPYLVGLGTIAIPGLLMMLPGVIWFFIKAYPALKENTNKMLEDKFKNK